jgi:hypothetical protein
MLRKIRRLSFVSRGLLTVLLLTPTLCAAATVTDCGDSGAPGQLRALINTAASGDTITLPACTITLTGADGEDNNASADLDIAKDLTIQGAGARPTLMAGGTTGCLISGFPLRSSTSPG